MCSKIDCFYYKGEVCPVCKIWYCAIHKKFHTEMMHSQSILCDYIDCNHDWEITCARCNCSFCDVHYYIHDHDIYCRYHDCANIVRESEQFCNTHKEVIEQDILLHYVFAPFKKQTKYDG